LRKPLRRHAIFLWLTNYYRRCATDIILDKSPGIRARVETHFGERELGMSRISRKLLSIAGLALLGLGALVLLTGSPAGADDYNRQGLQPPAYKYHSQYARKSGMYLNLGNIAYVRVPTIRLRVGAVKFREVQFANNGGVGHFVSSVGHYRNGPSTYGKQRRIVVPIATPYYYKPYGSGGPFYGLPSGYVANYYGTDGYGLPNGRLPNGQMGYGQYGYNTRQALQGLPNPQAQQTAYVGSFNKPKQVVGYVVGQQKPKPHIMHLGNAAAQNGAMPNMRKPAGKNFIRVE
jgi:hypothetical protein